MDTIHDDPLSIVYEFLSPADLARLSCVSLKFLTEHEKLTQSVWVQHLAKKWGISIDLVSKMKLDSNAMRRLYPRCKTINSSVICHNDNDVFIDPTSIAADFCGVVGQGNRSIQGQVSFSIPETTTQRYLYESLGSFANKFLNYFPSEWKRAFSVPTITGASGTLLCTPIALGEDNQGIMQYNIDLRSVSYYEVQIFPPARGNRYESSTASTTASAGLEDESPTGTNLSLELHPSECIAVGLATRSFLPRKRMPGWDNESFGYHSDDGAIFHGRGKQLAKFGPRFGYHDIIGCGFDHKKRTIFYTLNGKMLGTAFEDILEHRPLYPTVGIDAKCSVRTNFGLNKPFAFDITSFLQTGTDGGDVK
mmetsp:Transcript_30548/g.51156  ORF Transcript_30548/g.51156 Transcript_30548/m.51156 type:complete len:364 (+) Transcript_30548:94-1185(+)